MTLGPQRCHAGVGGEFGAGIGGAHGVDKSSFGPQILSPGRQVADSLSTDFLLGVTPGKWLTLDEMSVVIACSTLCGVSMRLRQSFRKRSNKWVWARRWAAPGPDQINDRRLLMARSMTVV